MMAAPRTAWSDGGTYRQNTMWPETLRSGPDISAVASAACWRRPSGAPEKMRPGGAWPCLCMRHARMGHAGGGHYAHPPARSQISDAGRGA
ncbi:hypothetical protein CFR75_10500 [Komagataeibacter xylinus]|uniref:Uncharacterized protein n=1 Tax=Komagataeibacter xylinus TaxID=28448 RepID=A0A318PI19_KOMXY|nr:hypothetical protein CFR75_10500 [Komagataeibacter xylinus]